MTKISTSFHPVESLADHKHEFGEHGGVNMSIEASTTFSVMDANTLPALFEGKFGPDQGGCYLYGRHFNPTVYNLSKQLAALEGTESAYCTSSGMGAISSTLLQLCNAGDEIVASQTIYGGTYALLHDYFPLKAGIHTTLVDIHDLKKVESSITQKTKVLYIETISNPLLQVADLRALSAIAKKHKLTFVVDNTFSPLVVSPAKHGADIVLHSLTKFINGSSDIIAGAICASKEFIQSLMDLHVGSLMLLGPTLDPHAAAAINLRLPHLALRIKEHSSRALLFAQRLQEMSVPVIYPGLTGHRDHQLLKQLGNQEFGFGGLFCIDLKTHERAQLLMNTLQNKENFGIMAVSLGYSETLMTAPSSTTSSEFTEEDMKKAGLSPGLVRISVGYTGTIEQRWSQLKRAVETIK